MNLLRVTTRVEVYVHLGALLLMRSHFAPERLDLSCCFELQIFNFEFWQRPAADIPYSASPVWPCEKDQVHEHLHLAPESRHRTSLPISAETMLERQIV